MKCAYCGNTSTQKRETFIFRGIVGVEATLTDFGNLESLLNRTKEN